MATSCGHFYAERLACPCIWRMVFHPLPDTVTSCHKFIPLLEFCYMKDVASLTYSAELSLVVKGRVPLQMQHRDSVEYVLSELVLYTPHLTLLNSFRLGKFRWKSAVSSSVGRNDNTGKRDGWSKSASTAGENPEIPDEATVCRCSCINGRQTLRAAQE